MSNILTTLFVGMADFREYAPGAETNNSLKDLFPAGTAARKRIDVILTPAVTDAIVTENSAEMMDMLRTAIANLTCCHQLVFDAVNRRKADTDVYRYELEKMQRTYMENYYTAMDSIIQALTSVTPQDGDTTSSAAKWRSSRYFKLLKTCRISTCEEFDTIFPIDLSFLFFFRTAPLQKECVDERLGAYYDRAEGNGNEQIATMLNLALAKKTIAKALRRFDILEFPPTIRNLFEENTSTRSGSDEHNQAMLLADRLDGEADELLGNVDILLSDDENTDFSTETSFNRPEDVIIMMP